MTSNLGSQRIQELAGEENYDVMKASVMEIVAQHFRPEFMNRVDDIVVFHPLGREHIRAIVDIQLGYLHERLADRDMTIVLTRWHRRFCRVASIRVIPLRLASPRTTWNSRTPPETLIMILHMLKKAFRGFFNIAI